MTRSITVSFSDAGDKYTLEYSNGAWAKSQGESVEYSAVWCRSKKERLREYSENVIEIAPVAALRFPAWQRIEEADPTDVLKRIATEQNTQQSPDPSSILGKLFIELWRWLADADPNLIGWASEIVARNELSQLAMLTLLYDTEYDALKRMSVSDYIPPPPAALPKSKGARESSLKDFSPDSIVSTAFQHEDRLSRAMDSFEYRAEQGEMAGYAWQAFSEEHHLMIEAGTGIGKSLAYLIPAMLLSDFKKLPVIISTNTINLQEQLLSNDIPAAQGALSEIPFSITLLKGRRHYFCRLRAREAMFGKGDLAKRMTDLCIVRGDAAFEEMIRLAFFQAQTLDGDMDTASSPQGLSMNDRRSLLQAVDCGGQTCLRRRCKFREACWFYQARDRAMRSNIVVMNHALLFSLFAAERNDAETVLSKVNHFVLDEAHNLEDVISDQFTTELTGQGMIDFANNVLRLLDNALLIDALGGKDSNRARDKGAKERAADDSSKKKDVDGESGAPSFADAVEHRSEIKGYVKDWIKAKRKIDKWASDYLGNRRNADLSLTNPGPRDEKAASKLENLIENALRLFNEVKTRLTGILSLVANEDGDGFVDDDGFQTEANMIAQDIEDYAYTLAGLTFNSEETIRWTKLAFTREGIGFRCFVCPLEVGSIFREFLDSQASAVMTSATLTAGGEFDYLKSRLGMSELPESTLKTIRLNTPFDMENQARVIIADDLPEPDFANMEPYHDAVARVAVGVAKGFKGGTLVLFNSYADLDAVAERAESLVSDDLVLLCQGRDGSRDVLKGRMRDEDGIVLFGTRSFWEGFDMPGKALRALVLTRMPFANFNDPVLKARAAAIKNQGGNDFMEFSVPQAAMRFAQGFGRLIRSRTDRGCIFILDSRIGRKHYGRVFIRSLPAHIAHAGNTDRIIPAAIKWYWSGVGDSESLKQDVDVGAEKTVDDRIS